MKFTFAEGDRSKDSHSCHAASSPATQPPPASPLNVPDTPGPSDSEKELSRQRYHNSDNGKRRNKKECAKRKSSSRPSTYNIKEKEKYPRALIEEIRSEQGISADRALSRILYQTTYTRLPTTTRKYTRGPYKCGDCGCLTRGHACLFVSVHSETMDRIFEILTQDMEKNSSLLQRLTACNMVKTQFRLSRVGVSTNEPHAATSRNKRHKRSKSMPPTRTSPPTQRQEVRFQPVEYVPPPEPEPDPEITEMLPRLVAQAARLRDSNSIGMDISDLDLSSYFPPGADAWARHIENVLILGIQIYRSRDIQDATLAIVSYMKLYCDNSIVGIATRTIADLVDGHSQGEQDNEPQSFETCPRIQDWNLFKNHFLFKKLSYLLSTAMMMGVCSSKKLQWNPFGLKVLNIEAAKQQAEAVDVIDACLLTFVWCCDAGSACIAERSFRPLLYTDQKVRQVGSLCDYIQINAANYLSGNVDAEGAMQDFEKKVDECLDLLKKIAGANKSGPSAPWVQKRFEAIMDIKMRLIAKNKNARLRIAPFGVGITGESCVGKSTLQKLVTRVSLAAMNYTWDPDRVITKDMFDKYDSTLTSDVLAILFDDIGNGKSQFATSSPTELIIKFFNNVAAPAVKAELYEKGTVFLNFKVGVMTSNMNDYTVPLYSNKPESILRRFIHTRVQVKEKYRIPGSTTLNECHPDILESKKAVFDIWDLTIEEVFMYENTAGKNSYKFRTMTVTTDPVVDKNTGKRLKPARTIICHKLCLDDYLLVIATLARRHGERQRSLLEKDGDLDSLPTCGNCFVFEDICKCGCFTPVGVVAKYAGNEPHSLDVTDFVIESAQEALTKRFRAFLTPFSIWRTFFGYKPLEVMASKALIKEFEALSEVAVPYATAILPDFIYTSATFQRGLRWWALSSTLYDVTKRSWWLKFFTAIVAFWFLYYGYFRCFFGTLVLFWYLMNVLWRAHLDRKAAVERACVEARDMVPESLRYFRDSDILRHGMAVATLAGIVKLCRIWYLSTQPQSGVETPMSTTPPPSPTLSKEAIDKVPSWYDSLIPRFVRGTVETDAKAKNRTTDQMAQALERNGLFKADISKGNATAKVNIMFPRSSIAYLPLHVFYEDADMTKTPYSEITVKVRINDEPAGQREFKVAYSQISTLPHLDVAAFEVKNFQGVKTRYDWFPKTRPNLGTHIPSVLLVKDGTECNKDYIDVTIADVSHYYRKMRGGEYTSKLCRRGACMGVVLADHAEPYIVGFHIGGQPHDNSGIMQTITYDDAMLLEKQLCAIRGNNPSAEEGDFPESVMGKTLLKSKKAHPQSMFVKLGPQDSVRIIGSTQLRATQRSKVQPSILSESVAAVTGVKSVWGPPALSPNWRAYNATMEHMMKPCDMISPDLLEFARQDWVDPLIKAVKDYAKQEDFRPLESMQEMVMGIPGKRFLDPVNPETSMGAPIFGSKKNHLTEVTDENGKVIDRIPDELVIKEYDRQTSCFQQNRRPYVIWAACLKDEATTLTKEEIVDGLNTIVPNTKVRVFQIVPFAFGLRIRKYFLPIARFLALHPTLSESAVGINSFSPQWKELMGHAQKCSTDGEMLAWDYSKYDARMSSQMTRAVLLSFIEIAEAGGYPPEAIQEMKAMVIEMAHPIIDWNGTMIQLYSINVSGGNITVQINGGAGSIYVRCGWYYQFDQFSNAPKFVNAISCMTYGDDFVGSILAKYKNVFNYNKYKEFCATIGMKITPPDKGSGSADFLDAGEVDFLKRKSVFIEEIGTEIGALDENSIFKSLHANVSKKADARDVARSCIIGALHEWFAHGREVYELRRHQMHEVCERSNLGRVEHLDKSFDDRVQAWIAKYRDN